MLDPKYRDPEPWEIALGPLASAKEKAAFHFDSDLCDIYQLVLLAEDNYSPGGQFVEPIERIKTELARMGAMLRAGEKF